MAIVCDRSAVRGSIAWLVECDPAWFSGEDLDRIVVLAARRIGKAVSLLEGRLEEALHPYVGDLHIARVAVALLLASRTDVRRDWLVELVVREVEGAARNLARFVEAEYERLTRQAAE